LKDLLEVSPRWGNTLVPLGEPQHGVQFGDLQFRGLLRAGFAALNLGLQVCAKRERTPARVLHVIAVPPPQRLEPYESVC
jgi:hypothetical protein